MCTKSIETDPQVLTPAAFTFTVLTHLQPHADRHVLGHLIHTASLSLFQSDCFICVYCGPLLPPPLSSGGDACLAAGTFQFLGWPAPRCICRGSSLSLQKAQRKKIRKLDLMKTRSTVSLSLSFSSSSSSFHSLFCHELGKTREEEN